jgi:sugar phosphate isomerase/epimerase
VIPNRLSAAKALVRLVEEDLELPPPGVGICLDTGHAYLMGDLPDAIETVGGALVTTHVHDNRGKGDDHLVPFDGTIDWPTALMSFQKVGYDGVIMFELENAGTPREVLGKAVVVRQRFEAIVAP